MRRVTIFGATGSIGQNTLDLIRRDREAFQVVALTGGQNIAQLARDAVEFDAEIAVTADEAQLGALRDALAGSQVAAAAGRAALLEAADRRADWTMSAIVGAAGLEPGLRSLRHGTVLALANKESLVCAGPILMGAAARYGAKILPVDSEHSAVFQALIGEDPSAVERVTITASGGAFRDWTVEEMAKATPEQAATHPNWDMGKRITVDSASLFNKAMELIETKEFFGFSTDQINAVIHPESLVHALVGFRDGGLMAHMGAPDMRHAIGFALYEGSRHWLPVARLDLAQIGQLTFRSADPARWPALRLARNVMEEGGLAGAAFNAAKEQALDAFLSREIGFLQMAQVVEATLDQLSVEIRHSSAEINLDMVLQMDHLARRTVVDLTRAG